MDSHCLNCILVELGANQLEIEAMSAPEALKYIAEVMPQALTPAEAAAEVEEYKNRDLLFHVGAVGRAQIAIQLLNWIIRTGNKRIHEEIGRHFIAKGQHIAVVTEEECAKCQDERMLAQAKLNVSTGQTFSED